MPNESYKKKLIEVALPLDVINEEAGREKAIRHGNPSTVHLWWARRPFAASRAVVFAQLVDDPSSHPDKFPSEEDQAAERSRLFGILEKLVQWENTSNKLVLEAAREEIRKSCPDGMPLIVDPFAGGGSIPLEAARLGLGVRASDLNPVAVLINKALIEIPQRWAGCPPIHDSTDEDLGNKTWSGGQGLAEDIRHYGKWMQEESQTRLGDFYPKATTDDGTEATVIAWLWARTVDCPNPACGVSMPLVRSFWLGKKKGKEAWLRPFVSGKKIVFDVEHGLPGPAVDGTVTRQGAICIACNSAVPLSHVRSEGLAGRMSQQLVAVVTEGDRKRIYLAANEIQIRAAQMAMPDDVPDGELPDNPRNFNTPGYGLTRFSHLFTSRQATSLMTMCDLISDAQQRIELDALASGMTADQVVQYRDDLVTYLAMAIDRVAMSGSNLVRWNPVGEKAQHIFGRQAIPMVWDYAETNPLASSTGSLKTAIEMCAQGIPDLPPSDSQVNQADARSVAYEGSIVFCTDPPYYDNISYAELADFFYVWLRRSLRHVYPDLLGTMLTPKAEELVATHYRFVGGKDEARDFFEKGFVETFANMCVQQNANFPIAVFYAFKQSEDDTDGNASTGWETMLEGLSQAGLMVTGTWPMRTEMGTRMIGQGTNALASSIVLACRLRPASAGVTDRAGFLSALRDELPRELRVLQQTAIAPVDLAQASIGPGMAVFSRYAKVIEPSGDEMRVRTALALINQVLAEVLEAGEGELDAPTRWALKWFDQRGFEEGPFGEAEVLATASGVAVEGLAKEGIVSASAGKVRLLGRSELPEHWDPVSDDRLSIWEATQHLVKALEEGGEFKAAALLERLGGLGDAAQALSYRLYALCERKGWAKEAGPYNALAAVWSSLRAMQVEGLQTQEPSQGSLL